MRWLHLTDLHIGRSHDQNQENALASLVRDIASLPDLGDVDCIFLTGDLAWSGQDAEYQRFEQLVLHPLRDVDGLRSARVFTVPGNHDLDCDKALPVAWDALGSQRQSMFFASTAQALREPRSRAFEAYSKFVARNGIDGVDPVRDLFAAYEVESTCGTVQIVTLNTSLLSDKCWSDEQKLPAPTPALREALDRPGDYHLRFVLGHHPVRWFAFADQEPLKSLLADRQAIYLHGHIHDIELVEVQQRPLGFGFGAVYQASLDQTQPSNYQNMYALCELDGDGIHVMTRSWDNKYGKWIPHHRLPASFRNRSAKFPDGHVLPLGHLPPVRPKGRPNPKLQDSTRDSGFQPASVKGVLIPRGVASSPDFWKNHLTTFHLVDYDLTGARAASGSDPGRCVFNLQQGDELIRIKCNASAGHVMSKREVEAENTKMDEDECAAVSIITLGTVADEARSLAQKLARRKRFVIRSRDDLYDQISMYLPSQLRAYIDRLDASWYGVCLLLENSVALIVAQRHGARGFNVLDSDGRVLPESDDLVRQVREHPDYASRPYLREVGPALLTSQPDEDSFDRIAYLKSCKAEFHKLRYAPLASVGLRFPNASLPDIYVPARAEAVGDDNSSDFRQAISDLLDTLHLDDAQRSSLESQIRSSSTLFDASNETGAARELYQQRGCVLIVGDPGSGKTCFIKSEILAYCADGPEGVESWYRLHTPVYVPLAEIAQLLVEIGQEFLDACATLVQRRGLQLTRLHLESLLRRGHVAFFFDGLDEVFALDMRTQIVNAIEKLVDDGLQHGNRFVLTSRPAATQMVAVPEEFETLHLRGFTDDEMRILARNLLRAEADPATQKVRFDAAATGEDEKLIDALLRHCQENPSIRRIARNPLLLTLLVMIYANHGPLAAKRHRIYDQAVQTLVSVRNRASGQQVLSESDLRRRLGAVALEIFRSSTFGVPFKDDVIAILGRVLRRERRFSDPRITDSEVEAEVRRFLQNVAELTGLIVIHERQGDDAGASATISFLHHSFLEYYAAVGLLEDPNFDGSDLIAASDYPRWQEVISIIAGILGDKPGADVSKFLSQIVESAHPSDIITQDRLVFGFDCAMECDVPPQEAQDFYLRMAERALREGAGLVDPDLRKALAKRLLRLFLASKNPEIEATLLRGMRDSDQHVRAAFVDLVGLIRAESEDFEFYGDVIRAFEQVAAYKDQATRIAFLSTLGRVPEFRTETTLKALDACLSESAIVRYVACRATEKIEGITDRLQDGLVRCLKDSQPSLAYVAAQALMRGGVSNNMATPEGRSLLEDCLRTWERVASVGEAGNLGLTVDKESLASLLTSPRGEDRVLGYRLFPWARREENFVYDRLLAMLGAAGSDLAARKGTLSETQRRDVVAALAAFRLTPRIAELATWKAVDRLVRLLAHSSQRDVRIGACRALAVLSDDETAISALLEYAGKHRKEEFREAIKALVQHAPGDARVHELILSQTELRLARAISGSFGDTWEQTELSRLLSACEELTFGNSLPSQVNDARDRVQNQLWTASNSYKTPQSLRCACITAYSRLETDGKTALKRFETILRRRDPILRATIGEAVNNVIHACRQRVDLARAILPLLPNVEEALILCWTPRGTPNIDDEGLRGIRAAMRAIRALVNAYDEFAAMKRLH